MTFGEFEKVTTELVPARTAMTAPEVFKLGKDEDSTDILSQEKLNASLPEYVLHSIGDNGQ